MADGPRSDALIGEADATAQVTRSFETLARKCEAAEMAASRSRHDALPRAAADALGAGTMAVGAGQLSYNASDVLRFNMVLGLGVAAPAHEHELDDALRIFRESGVPRCMIPLAPCARPPELSSWLVARGFHAHNHWLRFARDVSPLPAARTDLRIARFGRESAAAFVRMAGEAFGHPAELAPMLEAVVEREGWHHFGAFDGDELVASGAVFVHGDTAWLGTGATRATHRGRGAQSALISVRVHAAREAGCRWVTAETAVDTPEKPNPSAHNLRRLGFRELYERPNWVKVLRAG